MVWACVAIGLGGKAGIFLGYLQLRMFLGKMSRLIMYRQSSQLGFDLPG